MVVFISPPFAYNRSTRSVPKITLPFVTIIALIALSCWWWLQWRKENNVISSPNNPLADPLISPIILNSSAINTLVIVPCHSAYFGEDWDDASLLDDRNWWVFDNQKNQIEEFLRHLEYGVRVAAKLDSLLVFSGGQTRPIGPFSESQSYWNIARHKGWFGHPEVAARATTEEFALDSFDNLFYSICRYKEVTDSYPSKIIVLGFPFKRDRFVNLHRKALLFPEQSFQYISVPYVNKDKDWRAVEESEHSNAARPFASDPFACSDPILVGKKKNRNPYSRHHGYEQSCPELATLFQACREKKLSTNSLPWA